MRHKELHPGIYLLPNLFTTASLFSAFFSIVASIKGQYDSAVLAIFFGMIMDILDGRIARLTHTQSAFGAEYDSLSDMVTFGVAPSLLAYTYGLHTLGKIGWLVCFIYTASVALRLARFNTQVDVADKRYFQGLASPASAAVLASLIQIGFQHDWTQPLFYYFLLVMMVANAMFMISNIRYYSFKQIDFKGKIPFLYLIFIVILFVAIAADPSLMIFAGFGIYALSGPVQTLIQLHQVRRARKKERAQHKKKGSSKIVLLKP